MMKEFFKGHGWTIAGIVSGALGGFLYWHFVGCSTGSCPITSSPINSSIRGAAMGGLVLSSFKADKQVKKEK